MRQVFRRDWESLGLFREGILSGRRHQSNGLTMSVELTGDNPLGSLLPVGLPSSLILPFRSLLSKRTHRGAGRLLDRGKAEHGTRLIGGIRFHANKGDDGGEFYSGCETISSSSRFELGVSNARHDCGVAAGTSRTIET